MTQTSEQKEELKKAQEAAPSEEELKRMATRVPPLQRDDEHSFVPMDDVDREDDPELIQPDITEGGMAAAEVEYLKEEGSDKTITLNHPVLGERTGKNATQSTYERSRTFSETDLERLSDAQIEDAGSLKGAPPRFHPARLAPSSERPRQPGSNAPSAGAGSWPVHEGHMPAVMPSDPPLEDLGDRDLGENGFAKRAGLSRNKDGTLSRKGLRIEKNEVAGAASLFLRLRQQFPAFTEEQLRDEFELQWLSGRSGGEQSHRAGEELSQHGLTEVGDDRTEFIDLGHQRATSERAFEADPQPSPTPVSGAGAPSENEPASTATDEAKEPSGETAEADKQAAAEFAKFDPDNDGKPGGAPPGGNKKK